MTLHWEEFTHKTDYRTEMVRISLNGRGQFHLNQKAVDELGGCDAVVLMFERSERLIALRPSSADVEHAYRLSHHGSSSNYYIRARSFCNYYGIRISDSIVFNDVIIEDGLIVLALDNVTEVVRRARPTEFPIRFPDPPTPAPPVKFTNMLRGRSRNEE